MNNEISLQKAIDMTTLFRTEKDNIVNPDFPGENVLLICETLDREIFDAILAQPGCVKMRIYAGLNGQLERKSIIVGVNAGDEDMVPSSTASLTDGGGRIGEDGISCPPYCPPPSPLNP